MKLQTKLNIGTRILYRLITGKVRPILVSWSVTNRCNLSCRFCQWPDAPKTELDAAGALGLLDDMAQSGVRLLAFTGGEPLLRNDLPQLVNEAKKRGLIVGINTNGILLPEKFEELKNADYFQLSLDGPQELNDYLRGPGAYEATMKALDIIKAGNKSVKINTTITKGLGDGLGEVLAISRTFDVPIMFHPVGTVHAGSMDISELRMDNDELNDFFERLIQAKKDKYPILNSETGLRCLLKPPKQLLSNCYAGRLMVGMTPEGKATVCNQLRIDGAASDATGGRFLQAIRSLPVPACNSCLCANPMEMNLLFNFDLRTIVNTLLAGV